MLETARLKIRPFAPKDAKTLYEIHREDAVKTWFPNESYRDLQETREAIQFYARCVEQGRFPYVFAVERKDTGGLIGDVGLSKVDGREHEAEVGYVIGQAYRGNGYAVEALEAMSRFAASALGIRLLHGRVIWGNDASARVLEKSGYVFADKEFGAEDDPYGKGMLVYRMEPSAILGTR